MSVDPMWCVCGHDYYDHSYGKRNKCQNACSCERFQKKPLDNNNVDGVEKWAKKKAHEIVYDNWHEEDLPMTIKVVDRIAKELSLLKSQADELARAVELLTIEHRLGCFCDCCQALSNYRKIS